MGVLLTSYLLGIFLANLLRKGSSFDLIRSITDSIILYHHYYSRTSLLLLVQLEKLNPETLRQTVHPLLVLTLALQKENEVTHQQHATKDCQEHPKG